MRNYLRCALLLFMIKKTENICTLINTDSFRFSLPTTKINKVNIKKRRLDYHFTTYLCHNSLLISKKTTVIPFTVTHFTSLDTHFDN